MHEVWKYVQMERETDEEGDVRKERNGKRGAGKDRRKERDGKRQTERDGRKVTVRD